MNICINQLESKDAATIAGLLDERPEGIEARYDSRSYRCALHLGAILRRPRTVRFQWQGILRELRAPKLSAFPLPVRCSPVLSVTKENAYFALRKQPNYFTCLNN
jgi:hypothetical protein